MAKHTHGHRQPHMGGSGMNQHKEMAGAGSSGNFGVEAFHEGAVAHGGSHPDKMAKTGAKPHMADSERGIGMPVTHTKGHLPAQAAPDHGETHPGGHMANSGHGGTRMKV